MELAKRPFPPRFLLQSARTMARHVGMTEQQMQHLLPQLAQYQIFLSAALSADMRNFTEATSRFPAAYDRICAALSALESHPQLVVCAFHMAGMPLIATLVGAAWAEVHNGPLHAMFATRNLSWMRTERWRWTMDAGTFLGSDRGDLRRLVTGLRDRTIKRLLILVDGPHPPTGPGTRALSNLSPALGFKTGLLRSILSMNIPILPLTHFWKADRLTVDAHPLITAETDGVCAIATTLEDLLRSHPDQWLNWTAASLRT
jgi:hypothetical protein